MSLPDRHWTVGIVGPGRIGQAIAGRIQGFGTPTRYHRRRARTDVSYALGPRGFPVDVARGPVVDEEGRLLAPVG